MCDPKRHDSCALFTSNQMLLIPKWEITAKPAKMGHVRRLLSETKHNSMSCWSSSICHNKASELHSDLYSIDQRPTTIAVSVQTCSNVDYSMWYNQVWSKAFEEIRQLWSDLRPLIIRHCGLNHWQREAGDHAPVETCSPPGRPAHAVPTLSTLSLLM